MLKKCIIWLLILKINGNQAKSLKRGVKVIFV